MTARDRLVLVAMSALAVLAVVWLTLVSPEHSKAGKLGGEVSAATAQLATAEAQASDARAAQLRYSTAYSAVVSLGKAVPASEEVPSLIYQLAQASSQKHVEFSSISTGAGAGGGSASPSATTTTAVAATAGFTQMPFTFVFAGDFSNLYHLFQQLSRATVRTASGGLQVSGRLLTLQSVKLEPASSGEPSGGQQLTGTISATAYVLPATQGLTGGATATSPVAAAPAASAASNSSTASSSSAGSSSAPAAVIGAVR
jgi:hypothetical protein